jgi:hypothetical protein
MSEDSMEILIIGLLITVVSAWICYKTAKVKNLNVQLWVVLALFIGPLALPFIYFVKPKRSDSPGD